ncbi:MAG: helix-turn-helix domain-containing protein [Lachnospirales bacterium]
MAEEFELISHDYMAYKVFLVNLKYRKPHLHKDIEICILLEGSVSVYTKDSVYNYKKMDIWVINPFESHELKSTENALILSLQVPTSFFNNYFCQIENIEFNHFSKLTVENKEKAQNLYLLFIEISKIYFKKDLYYELKCASLINTLFVSLMEYYPYKIISDKEKNISKTRAKRLKNIIEYVDENFSRKLLLSEIAERENLSLTYLSHYFKDCYGISFQEYLLKIRSEKARQQLLLTDFTLLDICIACGFSDMKYFNKNFKSQYGVYPKEFKKNFVSIELKQQQQTMLTTEEFYNDTTSLILIDRHLNSSFYNI